MYTKSMVAIIPSEWLHNGQRARRSQLCEHERVDIAPSNIDATRAAIGVGDSRQKTEFLVGGWKFGIRPVAKRILKGEKL